MTEEARRPLPRLTWGPICGVLFVVFLVVADAVGTTPDTDKSASYLLAWYANSSHRTAVGISTVLSDIGILFGLLWLGYLRERFRGDDLGSILAPIMMAGAIVFAGGGLLFSGTNIALIDKPKSMLPATAQTLNTLSNDLGAGALTVGISVLMWAIGFMILRTRMLPRWLAWFSFLVAVAALAGPIGFLAFLATGVWTLIVAFLMWRRDSDIPQPREARPAV